MFFVENDFCVERDAYVQVTSGHGHTLMNLAPVQNKTLQTKRVQLECF